MRGLFDEWRTLWDLQIEFEGGLIRRARAFLSHAEALEAVGLTS